MMILKVNLLFCFFHCFLVNKHKPWIETSYHGVITENNDTVILDPPLVALDKDAPVPFAGKMTAEHGWAWLRLETGWETAHTAQARIS